MPDVLVIGDANPDLVLTGDVVPQFGQAEKLVDSADLVLGGSAAIVACGLARLGVPTALAAVVGDDLFGDFVRDALTAAGVDIGWIVVDADIPTALSVVFSAGERAILTYPGTVGATGPSVVDTDLLTRVRHVHSASVFLQPIWDPTCPTSCAAHERPAPRRRWTPTGIRPRGGPKPVRYWAVPTCCSPTPPNFSR